MANGGFRQMPFERRPSLPGPCSPSPVTASHVRVSRTADQPLLLKRELSFRQIFTAGISPDRLKPRPEIADRSQFSLGRLRVARLAHADHSLPPA